MAHPEVVDDNDMQMTISQMMQHTQSPQSLAVQRLDEIHLTEKQQTSPLVLFNYDQQQAVFSQSQSGETMVPSTYQPLDSIDFSQGIIKDHNQMGKFCDSLLEDNDQVIIKDLQQQVQDLQHQKQILEQQNHGLEKDKDAIKNQLEEMEKEQDSLKEKAAVLEKDNDAMKNQLLEMEKERDSLEEKLQNMDTLSNILKKERDEMENQLLEMGKVKDSLKEMQQNTDAMSNKILKSFELNTAELEKQKQMMLQQFQIEKDKIEKALMMQIQSLTTEKVQLQKYLAATEQRQKAAIVQKDAEIRSLTNKLSITTKLYVQPQHTKQPQKHLQAVETDSSLLTQRSEETIHNITQTYTDEKIEQVVHEVTQLYAPAGKNSKEDNKDENAKQRTRKQNTDDNYYYGSITKDGCQKEQIVIDETDEPQAQINKVDKIAPLGKKADIVFALLPDECQETIRKFWELEEGW